MFQNIENSHMVWCCGLVMWDQRTQRKHMLLTSFIKYDCIEYTL